MGDSAFENRTIQRLRDPRMAPPPTPVPFDYNPDEDVFNVESYAELIDSVYGRDAIERNEIPAGPILHTIITYESTGQRSDRNTADPMQGWGCICYSYCWGVIRNRNCRIHRF